MCAILFIIRICFACRIADTSGVIKLTFKTKLFYLKLPFWEYRWAPADRALCKLAEVARPRLVPSLGNGTMILFSYLLSFLILLETLVASLIYFLNISNISLFF